MAIRYRNRRSLARFIAPLASIFILGYFGFHAFNGQYGIRANLAMQSQLQMLETKLSDKTAKRQALEAQVALLRTGSLEKDTVDRYVRSQLNMVREDEIVILRPRTQ